MGKIRIDRVIFSRRKTLAIEITGDARLVVRAPVGTQKADILNFVEKKSGWIDDKQRKAEQRLRMMVPKVFVDGEMFLYL